MKDTDLRQRTVSHQFSIITWRRNTHPPNLFPLPSSYLFSRFDYNRKFSKTKSIIWVYNFALLAFRFLTHTEHTLSAFHFFTHTQHMHGFICLSFCHTYIAHCLPFSHTSQQMHSRFMCLSFSHTYTTHPFVFSHITAHAQPFYGFWLHQLLYIYIAWLFNYMYSYVLV